MVLLERPGRRILSPYRYEAWIAIVATLILTAIVLGTCNKISDPSGKIDWTLHFLDALHPMCGRNMMLPGFEAKHLMNGYVLVLAESDTVVTA